MNLIKKSRQAFTLVEVMLAVVIIGVLAALVMPGVVRKMKQLKVNSTKSTMETLKACIMDYSQDMGHFPSKKEGGLEALIQRPNIKGAEKWDGPYLEGKNEIPLDGWNHDFIYNVGSDIVNKDKYKHFEIISYGADGEPGGEGENADLDTGA